MIENNDDFSDEDINKENTYQTDNEYAGRSISDIADKVIHLDIPGCEDYDDNEYNPKEDLNDEDLEEQPKNKYAGRSITDIVDETIRLGNPTRPMYEVDENEDINEDRLKTIIKEKVSQILLMKYPITLVLMN